MNKNLKTGEKILFILAAVFIVLAIIAFAGMEIYRHSLDRPMFQQLTHFDLSADGRTGSKVFRTSGCTSCHRAMNNGTNMGNSLDSEGSRRSYAWLEKFLRDPENTYPARTMDHGYSPKEASYVSRMPDEERRLIAVFLSELTADQGSSSAPMPPDGRSEFIDNMVGMWAPDDWKDKYTDVRDKPVVEEKSDETEQAR